MGKSKSESGSKSMGALEYGVGWNTDTWMYLTVMKQQPFLNIYTHYGMLAEVYGIHIVHATN